MATIDLQATVLGERGVIFTDLLVPTPVKTWCNALVLKSSAIVLKFSAIVSAIVLQSSAIVLSFSAIVLQSSAMVLKSSAIVVKIQCNSATIQCNIATIQLSGVTFLIDKAKIQCAGQSHSPFIQSSVFSFSWKD